MGLPAPVGRAQRCPDSPGIRAGPGRCPRRCRPAVGGRAVISGASAGGFTVLCALATTDRFTAGASWFGISDLIRFRARIPRFQRHHSDHFVGPWPEAAPTYSERSPVHHAQRIANPVLVVQGLDDDIVAPEQTKVIVAALRQRGVPVTELTFPDEGHDFRCTDSVQYALEAELTFYLRSIQSSSSG